MFGGQHGQACDGLFHLRRHKDTFLELLSAMYHTVPHDINGRQLLDHSCFSTTQAFEHVRNHLWPRIRLQVLFKHCIAGCNFE